jgi:hypothetical protein
MQLYFSKTLVIFLFIFCFCSFTNAQAEVKPQQNVVIIGGKKSAEIFGKASLVIAKQTAKATWKLSKFAAVEVAQPLASNVLKPLVVKTTPQITKMLIKNSGILIKRATPIATKMFVTYLKL